MVTHYTDLCAARALVLPIISRIVHQIIKRGKRDRVGLLQCAEGKRNKKLE